MKRLLAVSLFVLVALSCYAQILPPPDINQIPDSSTPPCLANGYCNDNGEGEGQTIFCPSGGYRQLNGACTGDAVVDFSKETADLIANTLGVTDQSALTIKVTVNSPAVLPLSELDGACTDDTWACTIKNDTQARIDQASENMQNPMWVLGFTEGYSARGFHGSGDIFADSAEFKQLLVKTIDDLREARGNVPNSSLSKSGQNIADQAIGEKIAQYKTLDRRMGAAQAALMDPESKPLYIVSLMDQIREEFENLQPTAQDLINIFVKK